MNITKRNVADMHKPTKRGRAKTKRRRAIAASKVDVPDNTLPAVIPATGNDAAVNPPDRLEVGLRYADGGETLQIELARASDSARLNAAFGTSLGKFAEVEVARLLNALRFKDAVETKMAVSAAVSMLSGQNPKDEIEAYLLCQMAVTHVLVMRAGGLLGGSQQIPQQDSNALAFGRLTKAFTAQVEALAKLRRGGEQKVTVEHVHVYPGGQAIVGTVNNTGGAFGNQEQPYGANDPRTYALAECSPLRGQDPARDALPVASGQWQGPVSPTRGRGGIGRTIGRA